MNNKFRVWDGKKMWYPDDGENWLISQAGLLYQLHSKPEGTKVGFMSLSPLLAKIPSYMLATGCLVKDKDGNEHQLYEGDIVNWNLLSSETVHYLVKYDDRETAFMLYMHCKESPSGVFCTVAQAFRGFRGPANPKPILVGNQYEYSEMMEE